MTHTRDSLAALRTSAFLALAVLLAGCGEPAPGRYPVRGIDVSHHQGPIAWPAVAHSGVAFAYLKASEGGDFRDRRFVENSRGAARAGVPAGAYHFFTFCKEGRQQAENFLAAIATATLTLPPAIDLEYVGNCSERPSPEELRRELSGFTSLVFEKTGRAPLFYVTTAFMRAYSTALPENADVWIRSITFHPDVVFHQPWSFWQYAARGRVEGISGPVDLDVFNGTAEQWQALLKRPAR